MAMVTAQAQQFAEGQVWEYRNRAEESGSTLLINRIEIEPNIGEVFHISVRDVRVKNAHAPNAISTQLPHFPVSRTALESSVTTLVGHAAVNPEYLEGYATWRTAFEEGNAGVFTIPVNEIVDAIETTINQ
ncbi:hypothetical protein BJD12_16710 [Xanthomonas vesicatoria ATCC 35937]|nr:hypothetical protein BI313_19630 [Xanthomonas vesicatoria]APP76592.1 hypothetical protein BJD12_16710 [Xanthomonas vesicatoria ATCC 35937]